MTKRMKTPQEPARKSVEVEVECDTARLYRPLNVALAYLKEVEEKHPHAMLDAHWTGYEGMTLRFVYYRQETDEEMQERLEREEHQRRVIAEQAAREETRRREVEAARKTLRKWGER